MLQIRIADDNDHIAVRDFYYELIDAMKSAEFRPGWEKDIYPSQSFLLESISGKNLYIGELDGKIVSCMVVNHQYNDGYNNIDWPLKVKDDELLVIHALGVHAEHSGRGIAKDMVRRVLRQAAEKNIKTIRLDVLEGNLPAEKAYTALGFEYRDTIRMFYEDTGWTNFKVFECPVLK